MKQTTTTRFLNWLLALLGFAGITTSCVHLRCEYGSPYADFIVSGKVVDQKGNPIKDIVVTPGLSERDGITFYSPYDTLHTKADGSFYKKWRQDGFWHDEKLYLKDEDGPENGGDFELLRYNLADDLQKISEGGRWCLGVYEAKDLVIKLEEKKAE